MVKFSVYWKRLVFVMLLEVTKLKTEARENMSYTVAAPYLIKKGDNSSLLELFPLAMYLLLLSAHRELF